ncbi:hypothetical protein AQUCO_08600032v1 [Aquilegia coerulea]|uniref:KIB1-4 beta-propeller domain-containing protein n=1 Tax=Aquilegia coerulea TaxID=218851 RepID=A0A2G5C6L7_AQUCA|nr:hypothetical protein AQUCO_08600032v1 [Aquilegia coerulea]
MKKSTNPSRWSEIFPDLLLLITSYIVNYADYVRVRAVCLSWKSTLPSKPCHLPTQFPWLLLPLFNNNTISESHCGFFNFLDEKIYKLELPEIVGMGKRCWGSPHGWLIVMHEKGTLFSLLNPLTREQIKLPLLVFPSYSLEKGHIIRNIDNIFDFDVVKAILFASPSGITDFIVMVIMKEGPCGLAFFRFGTEGWIRIKDTEGIVFHDVVCFDGQFYAVDECANVYICDLGASPNIRQVAGRPESVEELEPEHHYLVESTRGFLLVHRYREHIDGTSLYLSFYFTVHKLDISKLKWCVLEDIGDQVLFLGTNASFSLSARDHPGCEGNSIYYTDDKRFRNRSLGKSKSRNRCIKGHDLGAFYIEGGNVEQLPSLSVPNPPHVKYMFPPPVWIIPSP